MKAQVAEVLAGVDVAALSLPGEDAQANGESSVIPVAAPHILLRPAIFNSVEALMTFPACLPHCSRRHEAWHAELSIPTLSKSDGSLERVL
jgi:hypothetical protein